MVYLIIGKQGKGKTTLAKNMAEHFSQKGIAVREVKSLEDLDAENSVLLIDDLKRNLAKSVINKIVENLRVSRHKHNIIILTHHLLRDIPSELLQLTEKVIMFQSLLNPNNINDKLNYLVSKQQKEALSEVLRELETYHYVILQSGKVYGEYSNMDIEPIIGSPSKTISLRRANRADTEKANDLLNDIYEKAPEFQLLTLTDKVRTLKELYPKLKPRHIAKIVGTNPNTVRVLLCRVNHS